MAPDMKMPVSSVVVWRSPAELYRRFRGACCFHHQGDEFRMIEAASTSETSVNFYRTTPYYNRGYRQV
jgi:hypothetical protein